MTHPFHGNDSMTRHENIPRFFVPSLVSGEVHLPDDEAHHAQHVLRLRAGAAVEVFDGRGARAAGEVTHVSRQGVTVQTQEIQHDALPSPRVHVAFAVPKGKRLDWLLEKATELAAASLQPIVFERSVAGGEELTAAKRSRWESHCIAAAKQSGLHWLPELIDTQSLTDFLKTNKPGLLLVGDLTPDTKSLRDALDASASVQDVTILVGPEGGFTPAEREAMQQAGYQAIRLGPTTFRIETAAVALLAGVRAILG